VDNGSEPYGCGISDRPAGPLNSPVTFSTTSNAMTEMTSMTIAW
jgi:hypothetical protein